jgi:hypothetical protein
MMSIQPMPASTAKWDDLLLNANLNPAQIEGMADNLETISIALVALTQIGKIEIGQAARDFQLESIVAEWIDSWSLPPTKSLQRLDVKELRALVLVISHLAQEYQALIRRNISYWEQTIEYRQLPLQSPSLADYISNFIKIYQERSDKPTDLAFEVLSEAALGVLVELLFYSSPKGHKRLWNALLQRSHLSASSTAQI